MCAWQLVKHSRFSSPVPVVSFWFHFLLINISTSLPGEHTDEDLQCIADESDQSLAEFFLELTRALKDQHSEDIQQTLLTTFGQLGAVVQGQL